MGHIKTAYAAQLNTSICRVDFERPDLCTYTDPLECVINGRAVRGVNWNWRDLLLAITEHFLKIDTDKVDSFVFQSGRPFMTTQKPENPIWRQFRQLSNKKFIVVSYDIPNLVRMIGKLCEHCGVSLDKVEITCTAKISDVLEREAILKNLNCAGMSGGKFCFTNAGALFFRVNDEDVVFRHAGIVCALYKGTDKAYILDAKELNGDIVSNVDDAIVFLKKHLRVSYKIEGLRRENILELPEDALREAVVNAICHRDYFEKGARVMVEIFDDRVDIVSPGGVCKGITRENFGTVSITRNSVIASMFFRIDYIEQMGTGIRRMRNAAREANVAEPEFEFTGFFKVTFKRNETENSIGRQSVAIGRAVR